MRRNVPTTLARRAVCGLVLFGFIQDQSLAKDINYLDPKCMGEKVSDCYGAYIRLNSVSPNSSEMQAQYQRCWYQSMTGCVVPIDIPTSSEIQAAMDAANKRQQDEWAVWLKTLEATGAIKTQEQKPAAH